MQKGDQGLAPIEVLNQTIFGTTRYHFFWSIACIQLAWSWGDEKPRSSRRLDVQKLHVQFDLLKVILFSINSN